MKYVSTRNKNVFLSASETIAQGLADDGGLLTVTKAGTTVHVKCSADQLAAVAAQPDGTFHLSFSYSQITNSGTLKDITPAG